MKAEGRRKGRGNRKDDGKGWEKEREIKRELDGKGWERNGKEGEMRE